MSVQPFRAFGYIFALKASDGGFQLEALWKQKLRSKGLLPAMLLHSLQAYRWIIKEIVGSGEDMFFFGHLGIGSKMAYPWRDQLPRIALLVGTTLPDLIDKPVYYTVAAVIGRDAASQSLISGTRTFAHTLIFLILIVLIAYLRKSRVMAALAVGVATHYLIDVLGDEIQLRLSLITPGTGPDGFQALLWPLLGWGFPTSTTTMVGHGTQIINPWVLMGEVAGILILLWDYRKSWVRPR